MEETFPQYESLATVVQILRDALESPESWALSKLEEMTARGANWKALKSAPPNKTAKRLALRVLKEAHSMRPLEPSYVTASAEGGVGIVYRANDKYAAFECLNGGDLRFLWFGLNGEPHARKINPQRIRQALKQVEALHMPNARSAESR